MKRTMITGHSGCDGTPWDSLESLEKAAVLKADAAEIDVRRYPGGGLCMSHDPVTPENIREKVPVKEAFMRIRAYGYAVNCDVKEQGALYELLDLAASCGLDREHLILTGCVSPEQIVRDPSIREAAQVFINIEEVWKGLYYAECMQGYSDTFSLLMNAPWECLNGITIPDRWYEEAIRFAGEYHLAGLNLPYNRLTGPFLARLKETRTAFSLWTVNDPDMIGHCIRIGSDNITTRCVETAVDVREKILNADG